MKILVIDTEIHETIDCPESHKTIAWYDLSPEMLAGTFVKGLITAEVPDECNLGLEPFSSEWANFYQQLQEDGEYLDAKEMIERFSGTYCALEVTTCGPVSMTDYFIVDEKYYQTLQKDYQ